MKDNILKEFHITEEMTRYEGMLLNELMSLMFQHDELFDSVSLRSLMNHMIVSKKPIVLHNGIIDLIFIYESFFAGLPTKSSSFIADLAMLFPSGVFDTKYISEYVFRYSASYLQYLFRKL